jgi:Zn-dependent M28 family amino/carboxypeptidase
MRIRSRLLIGALGSLAAFTWLATANDVSAGQRWWQRVQFLASDKMEGRLTGTEGYRRAAEYVAGEFHKYGLAPAGTQGYFQPVKFDVQRVTAADSKVSLQKEGSEEPLVLGQDLILGTRLPQPKTIAAPLVFAGYGLHIPAANYGDFSGLDVRGKIVVYLNGGPSNIAASLKSDARAPQQFTRFLEEQGAVGMLVIQNPKSMDIPWSRIALSASQPGMRLADPALQDSNRPMFTAAINPESASKFLAGSGHTFADLLALANAGKPLPRFPLTAAMHAIVATKNDEVESPNIAGILTGTDPVLKNEYVVYSAHLDHLGIGEPIRGDRIYNGAMDNASGVASMLEVAESLHENRVRLRRSVLFLVVCAEEKGLLGSRYYAAKPTVPRNAIVADLNTDMFLPLFSLNYLVVYGGEESTLGRDVGEVAAPLDIHIIPDRQPDRNIFIRSDQYNFIRAGVPSIMPAFGSLEGSPEAKTQSEWLKNRYHAPSDDGDQPVDLVAAAKFNQLMVNLTEKVANEHERPHWNETSFFKKFATN